MDRRLYAIASLMLVCGLGYYFFIPKCEQPDELVVVQAQMECLSNFNIDSFRKEVCKAQHGVEDCQLEEADRAPAEKMFYKKLNKCAKTILANANLCTDKYQDIEEE